MFIISLYVHGLKNDLPFYTINTHLSLVFHDRERYKYLNPIRLVCTCSTSRYYYVKLFTTAEIHCVVYTS